MRITAPAIIKEFRAHEDHQLCAVCHVPVIALPWARQNRDLQFHHLVPGSGKSDEWCCGLMLCVACHMCMTVGPQIVDALDGTTFRASGLTKWHCIAIKRDDYAEEWNQDRILELMMRQGFPDAIDEPLPECFVSERLKWEGAVYA